MPHYIKNFNKLFFIFVCTVLLTSCATYYEKNIKLQEFITSGQFDKADNLMAQSAEKESTSINRMLYWCNRGTVSFFQGKYEESNTYFNDADLYVEDYRKSFGNEALALVSNPMVKPYKPEDFEAVMVHYYKALNFIYLKDYEGALIEARRVNILLNQFNEKYKENKNKYTRDAFSHLLMGIIYEASGNNNDAFIAYRNAYDVYENDYLKLFNVAPPLQLKKDIIRTAGKLGFGSELDFYERKFGLKYNPQNEEDGQLVFFWMNGFGPVKDEWSINFTNTGFNDGWVYLENSDEGLTFPIYIGNRSGNDQNSIKNLSFLRVAFPKYRERKPFFHSGQLKAQDQAYNLELSQDVNQIAFQCLKDRMMRELANGIMRLATKKALEAVARNENEYLGALVSLANAVTEKADTRNWQSLPHSISYSRISLPEGIHKVTLETQGTSTKSTDFDFIIKKGETTFFAYQNLESSSPQ